MLGPRPNRQLVIHTQAALPGISHVRLWCRVQATPGAEIDDEGLRLASDTFALETRFEECLLGRQSLYGTLDGRPVEILSIVEDTRQPRRRWMRIVARYHGGTVP